MRLMMLMRGDEDGAIDVIYVIDRIDVILKGKRPLIKSEVCQ